MQWIATKKQLPPEGAVVLIYSATRKHKAEGRDTKTLARMQDTPEGPEWTRCHDGEKIQFPVTHWTELPAKDPRLPASMWDVACAHAKLLDRLVTMSHIDPDTDQTIARTTRAAERLRSRLDEVPADIFRRVDEVRDAVFAITAALQSEHPEAGASPEQHARLYKKLAEIARRHADEALDVSLD